ncbi:MAG: sodium:proton antiporter [Candidatus Hadarchaeales archaeon]
MLGNLPYVLIIGLAAVGIYSILVKRDLFKMIFGICILGYATNLFLVALGYFEGGAVPITSGSSVPNAVDPLLQALLLTAIVIEFGVLMLITAVAIKIFEEHKTTDSRIVGTSE